MTTETFRSQGGRLVGAGGEKLPLRSVELRCEAAGGIARTVLSQVFENPHREPLNLTYTLPLPASGAVAGFEVRVGEQTIRGEIDGRKKARKRYDQALAEGLTAGLLEQERTNLFTQNLGNVPPGSEVHVQIEVDQPLAWLPEGAWEWRFPTVAGPRYLGADGRVPDADRVSVDVADGPTRTRAALELRIGDRFTEAPDSPSHTIVVDGGDVRLPEEGAALDRDIVVRWNVASPAPGLSLIRARPDENSALAGSAFGLLTLTPPAQPEQLLSRDLIVLLDISGSMSGAPLRHAKELVVPLIRSLTEADRFELVAFASSPTRWKSAPVHATAAARDQAVRWIEGLQAGGATEMVEAIERALEPLSRDATRQAVVVTDGYIGFEADAIRAVHRGLPRGSRLHTVGVGSATNQAFLHAAARAGRGVEVLVGLDEECAVAAERLVAATRGPALIDVEVDGSAVEACAPRNATDVMASSPVLQSLRLRPEGGELVVRARTPEGNWERRMQVPATGHLEGNAGVTTLFGREAVEDLELDLACGEDLRGVDAAVEKLGIDFGIATRLTSWIAISEAPTVDRRQPVRVERIPQQLPYGLSAEGLGLTPATHTHRLCLSAPTPAVSDLMSFDFDADESAPMTARYLRAPGPIAESAPTEMPTRRRSSLIGRLIEAVSDLLDRILSMRQRSRRDREASASVRKSLEAIHELGILVRSRRPGALATGQDARALGAIVSESREFVAELRREQEDSARQVTELLEEIRELDCELERLAELVGQAEHRTPDETLSTAGWIVATDPSGSVTLAFTTDRPIRWRPGSEASIVDRLGHQQEVNVRAQGTTGNASIAEGHLVRIELQAPLEQFESAETVTVLSGDVLVCLHLEG